MEAKKWLTVTLQYDQKIPPHITAADLFSGEGVTLDLLVQSGHEVGGEGRLKLQATAELTILTGYGQLARGALSFSVRHDSVPLGAVVAPRQAVAQLSHAEPFIRRLHGQLNVLVFAQVNLEVTHKSDLLD